MDWITWCLMIPANGLIKMSAIFMYRRIFVVNKQTTFDNVSRVMLAVVALWTIAFFFATIFGCGKHFTYPWGPLGDIGKCNTNRRLDGLMISDLITDLLVWLLPIPAIWQLRMKRSRKASVTGVMMLAAVSLVAAIVRLIVQEQISHGGYAAHTDVNLTLTILLYWSMVESGLALIAACLPVLHVFVARWSLHTTLSRVRSAMRIDSLRSQSSSKPLKDDNYSVIQGMNVVSEPSYRDRFEATTSKWSSFENGAHDVETLPRAFVRSDQAQLTYPRAMF
ncbi:MAG: hypothetical protein Q9222_003027 [Ikaeria aurantiellina]